MAVGTVSGINEDSYQLIQTIASTSGATITFSSISGYKKLIVAWEGVSRNVNTTPYMTFNGSTSNYWGGVVLQYSGNYQTAKTGVRCSWSTHAVTNNGYIMIENVNNGAPKIVTGQMLTVDDEWRQHIDSGWTVADPITSITFTTSGAWSAGSMKLYGVAA
jgi:hypothetical protein